MADIERKLDSARRARIQLENDHFGDPAWASGGYEDPEGALKSLLLDLYELLLVALEASQLIENRRRLENNWAAMHSSGALQKIDYDSQFEYATYEPYEHLERIASGLRAVVCDKPMSLHAHGLASLEGLLRNTAVILKKRKVVPARELDIQEVMHDYLEVLFPEYTRKITLPGPIKAFVPDGGVRDLMAAVEFKFARSSQEIAKALGGIFEDVSGYSGTRDWTHFFSVVYQTEPFVSEAKYRRALTQAGAYSWTPILVTGGGKKKASQGKRKS